MASTPGGIYIDKLSKTYPSDKTPALNALSLQVHEGEVYGFLGANGAGKSTTIRLLLNFIQPTSGIAKIMGLDAVKESVKVKRHVGYLAGDVALYPKTTGKELLDYLASLQGSTANDYRQKLEKRFEANTTKPIGELSKGNRQKIGIIQSLMHRPSVLILDEPTSGLDPLMQEVFYDSIREARSRGAAVFMSSHNLTEAQNLCDRIGIIKHGQLIREQVVGDMEGLDKPTFRVTFIKHGVVEALKKLPELKFISQVDSNTLRLQPTDSIAAALATLSRFDIRSFTSEQADLESEFMDFYGSSK
jgi:ABC-2 type transport system ATP-binding protein